MPAHVPNVINDGNWFVPNSQTIEYEWPFSDKGDNATFHAYVLQHVDKTQYRTIAPMSVMDFPYGRGYLTKRGRPRDIGNGIYQFTDRYSSVPVSRKEYGSFTYTLQAYAGVGETDVDPSKYFYKVSWDLEENTFTVPAIFQFDYFRDIAPDPLLKPRLLMQFGLLYYISGTPINGTQLVAEDSQVSIYGALIFERKTPYVTVQSGLIANPP